jgi:ABC-type Fe3+/spermidine/putrescine transport system ATPase subunit
MMDLINMRERSKSYPRELSGGAQQKVAVGRAIATGSHLFLLDEPLGALDTLVRTDLRYELKRLASDLGLTVIHVTHDQEEALSIADRVVIMKSGQIVEVGEPFQIYHAPRKLFTENFVGETNLLEGKVLDCDRSRCVVDIKGHRLSVSGFETEVGRGAIIAIRPEFIPLTTPSDMGWRGRIKRVTFLGNVNRYVVEVEGEIEIVVEESTAEYSTGFRVGENVSVLVDTDAHILIFDYPGEGLEKEISLE